MVSELDDMIRVECIFGSQITQMDLKLKSAD